MSPSGNASTSSSNSKQYRPSSRVPKGFPSPSQLTTSRMSDHPIGNGVRGRIVDKINKAVGAINWNHRDAPIDSSALDKLKEAEFYEREATRVWEGTLSNLLDRLKFTPSHAFNHELRAARKKYVTTIDRLAIDYQDVYLQPQYPIKPAPVKLKEAEFYEREAVKVLEGTMSNLLDRLKFTPSQIINREARAVWKNYATTIDWLVIEYQDVNFQPQDPIKEWMRESLF